MNSFLVCLAVGTKFWFLSLIQSLSQTISFSCFLKQGGYHSLSCSYYLLIIFLIMKIFFIISEEMSFLNLHILGREIIQVFHMNSNRFFVFKQSFKIRVFVLVFTYKGRFVEVVYSVIQTSVMANLYQWTIIEMRSNKSFRKYSFFIKYHIVSYLR